MLDTTREFETPEGIELQLHVAGPISRASAWIIDALIRSLIYTIAMFVFALFGQLGWGVYLILIFLVEWFYPVIFEVKRGATPGKKIFKLYVCHDNGTPISWQASVIRNLLRVVDFLPLFYGLGLIAMLMNRDFKRLGDFAAGTLVIYKDQGERSYHVPEKKPLPLPEPLRLVEQRAILEFAERQEQLSEARGVELAQILNELTQQEGTKAKDSLLRYANWIQKGGDTS